MEYAIYKIIEGTGIMTIYIPEEVARKIAAAVLEEKVTIKSAMVNDAAEELCQAEIEIIYDD